MGITDAIKNQFRSVVEWDDPRENELFYRFTERGDELKNASKIILQEGQGCIFSYEGKIEAVFEEAGMYDLKTDNKPFITTIKKFLNAFESEHKEICSTFVGEQEFQSPIMILFMPFL
jgi:membrane protease subunit (stomatin/prohibitin family)